MSIQIKLFFQIKPEAIVVLIGRGHCCFDLPQATHTKLLDFARHFLQFQISLLCLGFVSNAAHLLRPHLFVHGSRGAVDRNDGSSNRWLAPLGPQDRTRWRLSRCLVAVTTAQSAIPAPQNSTTRVAAAVIISLAAPTTAGQRAAEEVPVQDESLSR